MKLLQPVQLAEFESVIYQGRMCLNVALKRNLEPSHCENKKTHMHHQHLLQQRTDRSHPQCGYIL